MGKWMRSAVVLLISRVPIGRSKFLLSAKMNRFLNIFMAIFSIIDLTSCGYYRPNFHVDDNGNFQPAQGYSGSYPSSSGTGYQGSNYGSSYNPSYGPYVHSSSYGRPYQQTNIYGNPDTGSYSYSQSWRSPVNRWSSSSGSYVNGGYRSKWESGNGPTQKSNYGYHSQNSALNYPQNNGYPNYPQNQGFSNNPSQISDQLYQSFQGHNGQGGYKCKQVQKGYDQDGNIRIEHVCMNLNLNIERTSAGIPGNVDSSLVINPQIFMPSGAPGFPENSNFGSSNFPNSQAQTSFNSGPSNPPQTQVSPSSGPSGSSAQSGMDPRMTTPAIPPPPVPLPQFGGSSTKQIPTASANQARRTTADWVDPELTTTNKPVTVFTLRPDTGVDRHGMGRFRGLPNSSPEKLTTEEPDYELSKDYGDLPDIPANATFAELAKIVATKIRRTN